ncbi:DUF932 domain-containing protein [Hyalangium versicolor]|uniref:DUF932 domain-containing protein n=1 Tax=Hyalangium versicolor TaxID=2861190 RepID=UPI001CC9AEAF
MEAETRRIQLTPHQRHALQRAAKRAAASTGRLEHPRLLEPPSNVIDLFHADTGIEGLIRGTVWGALQVFSEFADHHWSTRATKGKSAESARLESIWRGLHASMHPAVQLNTRVDRSLSPRASLSKLRQWTQPRAATTRS